MDMEAIDNTQPVESFDSAVDAATSDSPVQQTTGEEQTTESVSSDTVSQSDNKADEVEVRKQQPVNRQNNWNNGRRRIAHRESMRKRIAELQDQLAALKDKEDDYSLMRAEQISDRLSDMAAAESDAVADEWADRAEPFFGDKTGQFMSNVYRYADYVNNYEPSLQKYLPREYGPVLLQSWMHRMDNPSYRQEWLRMTQYEKEMVLDNNYNQIISYVRNAGQSQQQKKPANVPVPAGGRETPSSEPSSDFGIELGKAFARHKGR